MKEAVEGALIANSLPPYSHPHYNERMTSGASLFTAITPWRTQPLQAFGDWIHVARIKDRPRRYSARSIKVYQAMWGKVCRYMEVHRTNPVDMDAVHIEKFLGLLRGKSGTQAGESIRRRYVTLLALVFDEIVAAGLRADNPARDRLVQPKTAEPKFVPPILNEHEVIDVVMQGEALEDAPMPWRSLRDQAALQLTLASGLKVTEICALEPVDLDLDADPPTVRVRKWGRRPERTVPIEAFALPVLRRWLELRDAIAGTVSPMGNALFPSKTAGTSMNPSTLYRGIAARLSHSGIRKKHLGPALLRHTYATARVLEGKDAGDLTQLLGYAEARSGEIYEQIAGRRRKPG